MVRSGSVTGSPKASPGCNGDGEAGPAAGGGIGSLALGLDGAGEFCATPGTSATANARKTTGRASLKGDITVLRRCAAVRRFASIVTYPTMASGQSASIRHIKQAKPGQSRLWALSPISPL